LARKDSDLKQILKKHGYPPMWTRPADFSTLVLTILEQQVSLASAYAAFKKLKEKREKEKGLPPQELTRVAYAQRELKTTLLGFFLQRRKNKKEKGGRDKEMGREKYFLSDILPDTVSSSRIYLILVISQGLKLAQKKVSKVVPS